MKKKLFLILFFLLFIAKISLAQEKLPEKIQIDLLIFRHITATPDQINNILSLAPQQGDITQEGVKSLTNSTNKNTIQNEGDGFLKIVDSTKLENEIKKISQSEYFEIMQQITWQQPVYSPHNALFISLSPNRYNGLLKGTAKISFDRYFQLAIDLLYEPDLSDAEPTEQDSPESKLVLTHLTEVMTDNKLYYLDHPLLGVLAKVTVIKFNDTTI